MIDSHSHIFEPEFDEDRDAVIARSKDAGVIHIYMPNIDLDSVGRLEDTSARYLGYCSPMMGLHPTSVTDDYKKVLQKIEKLLAEGIDRYIGVGEIGLDLYWSTTYYKEQLDALETQLDWACQLHLPVSIHSRNAFDEVYTLLRKEKYTTLRGVMHSFCGTLEEARKIMILSNFKLGINGVVTFKNSTLPEVLKSVPLEKLVLETDAPYLAPVPYRGKRNEPSFLPNIVNKLSEIYDESCRKIMTVTTDNAQRLFDS